MVLRCRLLALAGLVSAGLLGVAAPARAQNNPYTWNTAGGAWSLPANWRDGLNNPGVPPSGAATALAFHSSDPAGYTATNDLGSFTLNSITFNNAGTGLVTVAGDPIALAGADPTVAVLAGSAAVTSARPGPPGLLRPGPGR